MESVSGSHEADIEIGGQLYSAYRSGFAEGRRGLRVALVGTFTPRRCGIATFTADLARQLALHHPEIAVEVHALDDPGTQLRYENVAATIAADDPEAFRRAARRINESGVDAVWLQHEYGIFGGESGEMVRDFVDRLAPPLILTLHTVLSDPQDKQREILHHLASRASQIMVMSRHSRDLLKQNYGVSHQQIDVIEHGAPDRPFGRQSLFKGRLGLGGRKVLMTFGLLGPDKGLEHVIRALPAIVERHPEALYRIVGATHPNLLARDGEAYRAGLMELAEQLGVTDHIAWENRFLENDELLDQLEACDVYLTPYLNLQQSTSGTLSYAVALGKAVISTPYVHARELLADGAGMLIEPGSPAAISAAVIGLLDSPDQLLGMQRRAYARGRETIWPKLAEKSARLIESVAVTQPAVAPLASAPGLGAVFVMSDATGILQHSIGIVPDRRHGYCLDDNARALMLMNVHPGLEPAERLSWSSIYAAFVQSAWNEDLGRFRNFMRFDRTWCEDVGSEDSNGRALWALGHTYENSPDSDMREWAGQWFDRTISSLHELSSPRARAFAALGACAVLRVRPNHLAARDLARNCGAGLVALLREEHRHHWGWFETVLGYDNSRLCQAMIEIGAVLGDRELVCEGLETLAWIAGRQVSAAELFRPVGSESFGRAFDSLPFDQQPLEAHAAIEAARSAYLVSGEVRWVHHALRAWEWFFGANDRGVCLVDMATGRCRDGLTPRGINRNTGAESILAFQLSHHAMAALGETGGLTLSRRKAGADEI